MLFECEPIDKQRESCWMVSPCFVLSILKISLVHHVVCIPLSAWDKSSFIKGKLPLVQVRYFSRVLLSQQALLHHHQLLLTLLHYLKRILDLRQNGLFLVILSFLYGVSLSLIVYTRLKMTVPCCFPQEILSEGNLGAQRLLNLSGDIYSCHLTCGRKVHHITVLFFDFAIQQKLVSILLWIQNKYLNHITR